MLSQPLLYLLVAQAYSFLIHPYPLTQSVRLPTLHCAAPGDLLDAMLCHWLQRASHPTLFTVSATDLRERCLLSGVFLPYTLYTWESRGFP